MTNPDPNYDSRLEPRRRERSPEERTAFLASHYESFLRGLAGDGVVSLFFRLNDANRSKLITEAISMLLDERDSGRLDKGFMSLFTDEEILYESEA